MTVFAGSLMKQLSSLRRKIKEFEEIAETNGKWQRAYAELYTKYKELEQKNTELNAELDYNCK